MKEYPDALEELNKNKKELESMTSYEEVAKENKKAAENKTRGGK